MNIVIKLPSKFSISVDQYSAALRCHPRSFFVQWLVVVGGSDVRMVMIASVLASRAVNDKN